MPRRRDTGPCHSRPADSWPHGIEEKGKRMRTRRLVICAAAAVALVAAATACGSKSGGSSGSTTITFATNQITAQNTGTTPVFKKLISDFQKQNPGVRIQLQTAQATALQQLIQLSFSSHKVPDVFNFWRPQPAFNMDKYIASGQLGDLSPLAKTPSIQNEFPSSAWSTATVGGKVRGLPLVDFSVPFVVNKAVFAKANLPLPTTWQTLVSDVPALKAKGFIPWTLSTEPADQSDDRLLDYVLDRELGNDQALTLFKGKVSFSSPQLKKAISDYLSISTGFGPSDAASLDDNAAIAKYFNTGKSAMLFDNSGYLPSVDKTVAKDMTVLPFPTIPGGAQTSPHVEKDLTTLMYASASSLSDPKKGPLVKKFLTAVTSLSAQNALATQSVLVPATKVSIDPAKTGQLFADVQKLTSAEQGDKWLGNARTPSQQQSFYPFLAQAWTGKYSASAFASQLETMFHQ
jgi:raffinose/stachyose/melibiose transport system substrate-binding protein